ncbi:A-kinase anchor protein 9-like isoform X2 [Oryzias latipes]|uniref:A-kinase anchor protein 9-like isoform X2 n=1 Tax=Oryzias latipes TaxID=8090 RepID=UPI000CE1F3BF|nr:A-kinase anchor protein 9-like isoform X2 [Oryzias latipes]
MDEDERQRKLEAGRAKSSSILQQRQSLASFRQKRAKSNAGEAKKTQKRKGPTDPKNDSPAQDCHVEQTPPSASATKTNHKDALKPDDSDVEGDESSKQPPTPERSPSPVEVLGEGELAALTGKEQLKQLQLAVEKRNDIIAKLSSNLQEALASRDLVQLEAHSLAEQIRALQKQLQQTSVEFQRIKVQSGAEVSSVSQHHHSLPSQDLKNNLVEEQTEDPTHESSGSCAVPEGFNLDGDSEIDTILHKLRFELEEEKKKNQRINSELAEEIEKKHHVLLLLEKEKQGREEEPRENEATLQNLQTQLSQVQTQCLAVQQHKEEKAKLDREINELRQILQKEENGERRSSEDIPGSALYLQNMEDERQRQEEEMKKLKEEHRREIELVRRILEQREQELQQREEEVKVLKDSANHPSHTNASIGSERTSVEEANVERGLDQDGINASIQGDILMERYLASAPLAYSQSSVVNESSELCSQLDLSADYSFELNSDPFQDQPLLSISSRPYEENEHWQNISSQHSIKEAGDHQNFSSDDLDLSQMSQQQFEKTDLEKDLLNQQCLELQEELALKERDLEVLKEEVLQSAEELEEARSRWAQVTEELRHALWELEEEKQKRRDIEEEMKTYKEDHLQETGTLIEREEEDGSKAMTVEEAESSTETFLLTFVEADDNTLVNEVKENENKSELAYKNEQEELSNLQNMTAGSSETQKIGDNFNIQTLLEHSDCLVSELEKTKTEYETTSALLSEKTIELETVLKELETTRVQVVNVQKEVEKLQKELLSNHDSLQWAGKVKSELEAQISCLQQNLASLEEAEAQSVQQREEVKAKEQQMEEQIKKMEQVLEEELEQFENILKAKDAELADEREKWETEKQEKEKLLDVTGLLREQLKEKENEVKALLEKQVLAVQEATEKLNSSHQQQIKLLTEKHQQEILELNAHLESELTKLQVSMEEEQKRQIGLIKQVTEREHERVISELTAKNKEELNQLRAEVSLELRESMEAAHQAELQQIQVQKALELEALRLSLTSLHTSHMEHCQENVKQDQTAAQTLHQLDVDHSKQSQEQEGRLLHQQKMDGLEEQWDIRVAEERAFLEEKHSKDMQALKAQWQMEKKAFQESFSDIQNTLTLTQAELTSTKSSLTETTEALSEAKATLREVQAELQQAQARMQELQTSSKEQLHKLQEELKQVLKERDSFENLVLSYKTELQEKEQHALRCEEKERQLKQEVVLLEEEKILLKQNSEEEMGQLWTQLESMRASRRELGELKEQLLARSSHVDDIERLKVEFNEQKKEIKEQNEAELENLRRYFEKRLHASEESYKEEIALLQMRLVESALEESVILTSEDCTLSQVQVEEKTHVPDVAKFEEQVGILNSLKLELEEKHSLELSNITSSMALSFKEELQQTRSDITHHYHKELQEQKTMHALELEQLRAKVSDVHLKDLQEQLTRAQLEAARQAEVEIEQRMWCLTEELHAKIRIIHVLEKSLENLSKQHDEEMQQNSQKLDQLEKALNQEREILKALQQKTKSEVSAINSEEGPQSPMMKPETRYDIELEKAKTCMSAEIKELTIQLQKQSEEKLHQAQQRFQAEKTALEQHLVQKYESSLAELKNKCKAEWEQERMAQLNNHSQEMDALNATHTAQQNSLNASHKSQLAAVVAELESKHRAELVALEATLHSKRKEDLERLEAVFQETNQVQLEALEAELSRKHQEETDELEKRMLGNMDTLEATYLKEVQALRNDIVQLKEKHKQELIVKDAEHKNILEQLAREQLSIREELRKELAQLHMEKFKAMAAELSFVQKNELASQKEALDAEHCKALEALKKQVFDLEQQHNTALQDLTNTYAAEKDQLTQQFKLQLQELRGTSARELQAARRELEEESSRQRQHYLEEVELLKVRSEEKLQDKINQLMTEFEDQKEVELEELRRSFASDQQEKEQSYTNKMSQLTVQLQQLDSVVAQLRAEVGCLQGELQGKSAEMETMDTLLQRRERESQEGANLLKMLTDDLQAAKEEKFKLHHTNEKLAKVLVEMFRGIRATEEQIGQKINVRTKSSEQATQQRSSTENKDAQESGISVADLTSDDLEMTQLLCESLLVSDSQINPVGEESVLNACCRLRQAVDMLLDLLNQANTQLEETRNVHLSLEEKFSKGKEDSVQLLEQHKLLLEQLDEEAKMKSQLQLELHKAEGLLEGYVAEKAVLEESLQQKENQEERLVEELEDLKTQLQQMQGFAAEVQSLRLKHQELVEENAILLRQKEHLSAGLGEREKALLAETERLTQDRLDLQRQAEKDHKTLTVRLRNVERELEEQETMVLETEMHNKTHTEDLNQRVQALEKQLKHNRQFIEEQAVEREHERDEFQQEIHRLEAQLRQPTNVDHRGSRFDDLVLQLETLHAIIKDKTEDYDSLMAANQQAQRDLTERNEEIDKLAGRIRELEQALLNSTESVRTFQQLEQELHKAKQREQELTQDKLILEQQQLSSRLQISALQSKLDETRHCYHDNAHDPTHELRDALDTAQQKLHSKEQEAEILLDQLETVQKDLTIKEVELKHLTLQLELLTERNTAHVQELQEQISYLQEKASTLTINVEEEEECIQMEETEEETLPSALLNEKNQEIDHLSSEIQRLEQDLESARDDKISALEGEVEDLRSQVERLQSEVARVRHDKQEEEERLHEVISTLQAELATLGPNLHEVSDSQDGDSFNPSPAPSPEPRCVIQEQEMGGKPSSLKHELNQTHSGSSHSLRSRLKSLQSQLETAAAEKESLERILLTQEEEFRGQGEEFGKRLKAERKKLDEIQDLLKQKEAELEEVKAQAEEEKEARKLAEKERDRWKAQAEDVSPSHEKMAHLQSLVLELQNTKQDSGKEIEMLKTKEKEMKTEMEVLQEAGHTLERQVQEMRAELVDMEKLVAEGRSQIKSLETVKGELSAECELLRKREDQLREEIVKLDSESASMKALIQDLTMKLQDQEARQEKDQKPVLTHADGTRAKADAALRQKEFEFDGLKKENQALRSELTAVKQGLSTSSDKAHKLHEEGQIKDRALFDLETDNRRLNAELQRLQKDLTVQEEEVAYQKRELQLLRQHCHEQNIFSHHQEYSQKNISHAAFKDTLAASRNEAFLSSPEVLRRLECSEDRIPERFHTSVLDCHLSGLSGLNSSGLDPHKVKISPRVVMEPLQSRTITPDQSTQRTHSPGSLSISDNFSLVDSIDAEQVHELEGIDQTAPPSPLGSTSSMSAQEWASDGYGSNVSSELGARLRVELEQTERLDAQFVEYLRCRGMNPTVNTDSAAGSMSYTEDLLSPELQGLLKKVYHESCKILTLSQRRVSASIKPQVLAYSCSQTQSKDNSGPVDCENESQLPHPPMSWQQEKRALQETVIALRELLCRMAQRHSQMDFCEDNWRTAQLQIDGTVDVQMRTELEEKQKQLQCAHDALKEHKSNILSLRLTIEENDEALQREKSRVQELQCELEQEKALNLCKEKDKEEQREALQVSSEELKAEVLSLKSQVKQEMVTCSNLRQELQIEQSRSALLEKRLEDTLKMLEDGRQHSVQQQELNLKEKNHLGQLLDEAESRLADMHSKLADCHRKIDDERERCSQEMNQLCRRHEADAARDRKFISDLRSQLEQERRQGEGLADAAEKLRTELLESRRKWEEEDKTKREEFQREQEAAAKLRVLIRTLKEQKREISWALEAEQERRRQQEKEVAELKERLQLLKIKEKEMEEQWERERRKTRQEQMDRERRQEKTKNKLLELQSLRQQDHQRVQELQQTLAHLEKDKKEMAAQRLIIETSGQQQQSASAHLHSETEGTHSSISQKPQQISASSSNLLEKLLKENSELNERITSLSQERSTYKHRLSTLEKQLRRTESDLSAANTERENRPIGDPSCSRLQRYYERYLRAESFRKALVYQKRYLLLLLGGFQECEQATLCLIARMGARPSTPLSAPRRPIRRFRAAVQVIIALSRMKFLTRKWQKAIRRPSLSATGHAGPKVDVLRQQQPISKSDLIQNRASNAVQRATVSALVPPSKSPFRLHNRSHSSSTMASVHLDGTSQDPEQSLTEYIHHLEKVQQRLVGAKQSSAVLQTRPK